MADITKIKLPNNSVVNIKDSRIPGVDTEPTPGSNNVVTSGGIYTEIVDAVHQGDSIGSEVYIDSGSVVTDLSGYATKAWVEAKGYLITETDPGVYPWAKEATKPTYTASEVGALPSTTAIPTESTVSGWGFTKNTGTYSKPSGGIPLTDLASGVQTSLGKADTALQSYTETDPTVPSWAKASTKPTYTASEVGALPSTTTIPSKTSDLTNDSSFVKYVLLNSESEMPANPDSGTLYLIPE